jgi:hypothetical protein
LGIRDDYRKRRQSLREAGFTGKPFLGKINEDAVKRQKL